MPVQIQGRLRGQVTVPAGADEAAVLAAVRADEGLARHLAGREIRRVVLVPDRLVNWVLG